MAIFSVLIYLGRVKCMVILKIVASFHKFSVPEERKCANVARKKIGIQPDVLKV